jgi:hypothetical protein
LCIYTCLEVHKDVHESLREFHQSELIMGMNVSTFIVPKTFI